MKSKYTLIIIAFFCSLFYSQVSVSQKNTGIIKGKIIDKKNNDPISFATIVIDGTTIGTTSDVDGNFLITGVTPGYVDLRVQSIGYKTYITPNMLVTNANAVYIDVVLEEEATEIKTIVVNASPFRREVESPVSLRRIDIREIEKNPGGNRDISKVIQAYPGVSSTPAYRNDIIVRGGGSSENRFYLDGVEIPNINHFATQGASGGPVGIINVDFVREVNFYSGAFPADRGNALSSVLEFKQIDANQDKFKTRLTVGASDLGLALNGPISKNTGLLFSVRRSYLQFLFSALGLPFLPIYNDIQFKTRTKIDSKNEISVIGLGALDNAELNTSANKTEEQRYILGYLPASKQWNYTLGVVYKHYTENGYDTWVLSRNMLDNSQYKYLNNIEVDSLKILDYLSWESENKLRYEHNTTLANDYKLNFGAGGEYVSYYNKTFRLNSDYQADNYKSDISFFKYHIFSQLSKSYFSEKLNLSLGARLDGNSFSSTMSNPLDQFSPRFSASYKLLDNFYINSNVGHYYQLPPYTALGYKNAEGNLSNKDLKYISVDHIVAGVEYLPFDNSRITVEGFWKNYQHYMFSVNDSVALASKGATYGTYGDEELVSTGNGRAYGLEVLFQHKNLFGAMVTLSYTLVRSEFEDINGKYVPSAWDNRNLFNIVVSRSFKGNWDFGFKWRYVGGSPYTPAYLDYSNLTVLADSWNTQGRTSLDYSKFNQLRLNAFNQLDIRLDKQFYYDKWSLMLYVDIQNVMGSKADSEPTYVRDVDANGQALPAYGNPPVYKLKKLAVEGSGTILPTLGVMIEF
jgi:hypothetical protein